MPRIPRKCDCPATIAYACSRTGSVQLFASADAEPQLVVPDFANKGLEFGTSLAFVGTQLVVGGPGDSSCADNLSTGLVAARTPDPSSPCVRGSSGAVYVFDSSGAQLAFVKMPFSNGGWESGTSVSAVGDAAFVVGAPGHSGCKPTLENFDNRCPDRGAAFLFAVPGTLQEGTSETDETGQSASQPNTQSQSMDDDIASPISSAKTVSLSALSFVFALASL